MRFIVFLIIIFIAILSIGFSTLLSTESITLLDHGGILLGYIVTCITSGLALTAYFKRDDVQRWLQRQQPAQYNDTGKHLELPVDQVDALILPVSREQQPQWLINHLKPKHVGLVYTEYPESLAGVAKIINNPQNEHIQFLLQKERKEPHPYPIKDANNPLESKHIAIQMINELIEKDVNPANIFIDTTGGKVPMSIGLFQAAEEHAISSIYLNGIIKDPSNILEGSPIYISRHTPTHTAQQASS